jgi:SAM-dependent methyltransferase
VDNGWQGSAAAWIADQGEHGDFGRRYVLDPVMLSRAVARAPRRVLDVGCGEGRFCRMLADAHLPAVGLDPTPGLIAAAQARDRRGRYVQGDGERLPFTDHAFDLVVSYLSLVDIADFRTAVAEMSRVLQPGGALLVANLTSFSSAQGDHGWHETPDGIRLHYRIDHYLAPRAMWIAYRGIRILNHHRPLRDYMQAFLGAELVLAWFDEPSPTPAAPLEKAASYRRVPYFLVMEWRKPG